MLYFKVKHTFPPLIQYPAMSDMGGRIRARREELGFEQPDLAKACGVSKSAISQWELGHSTPTGPNLVSCATFLRVRERWLTTGRGPKEAISPPQQGPTPVPLIDFVAAGSWSEPADSSKYSEVFLVPRYAVGPRAFALTIQGRSMEPEFHDGDDIIVDPDVQPKQRDFVVAKREHDHEATFKQYYSRQSMVELRPLNASYETLQFNRANPGKIIGVVVEHRSYRR